MNNRHGHQVLHQRNPLAKIGSKRNVQLHREHGASFWTQPLVATSTCTFTLLSHYDHRTMEKWKMRYNMR
jgi:uncharacterized membrane protein YhiD involved in acid resistance